MGELRKQKDSEEGLLQELRRNSQKQEHDSKGSVIGRTAGSSRENRNCWWAADDKCGGSTNSIRRLAGQVCWFQFGIPVSQRGGEREYFNRGDRFVR